VPCLNCETFNFCFDSRFLYFSRNRLAAHELPLGSTCVLHPGSGISYEPPGGLGQPARRRILRNPVALFWMVGQ